MRVFFFFFLISWSVSQLSWIAEALCSNRCPRGAAHPAATSESGARSAAPLLSGNVEAVFTDVPARDGEGGLGRRRRRIEEGRGCFSVRKPPRDASGAKIGIRGTNSAERCWKIWNDGCGMRWCRHAQPAARCARFSGTVTCWIRAARFERLSTPPLLESAFRQIPVMLRFAAEKSGKHALPRLRCPARYYCLKYGGYTREN